MATIYEVMASRVRRNLSESEKAIGVMAKRAYIERAFGVWLLMQDLVREGIVDRSAVQDEEWFDLDKQRFEASHALDGIDP